MELKAEGKLNLNFCWWILLLDHDLRWGFFGTWFPNIPSFSPSELVPTDLQPGHGAQQPGLLNGTSELPSSWLSSSWFARYPRWSSRAPIWLEPEATECRLFNDGVINGKSCDPTSFYWDMIWIWYDVDVFLSCLVGLSFVGELRLFLVQKRWCWLRKVA